jgi:1,4-dihydroxy-6-naphthoate synthase
LTALADLGEWWEADTGLPIPLGAILARRDLNARRGLAARTDLTAARATDLIRASVRQAWARPADSAAYVADHAQEMDPDVQRRHIDLYVNNFTEDLGDEGYAAIEALLGRAHTAGLVPAVPPLR